MPRALAKDTWAATHDGVQPSLNTNQQSLQPSGALVRTLHDAIRSHAGYKLVTCWRRAGHEQLVRCLHSGHVQISYWVHAYHVLISCTLHTDNMQVMHGCFTYVDFEVVTCVSCAG